jgi:hypothetical protein
MSKSLLAPTIVALIGMAVGVLTTSALGSGAFMFPALLGFAPLLAALSES